MTDAEKDRFAGSAGMPRRPLWNPELRAALARARMTDAEKVRECTCDLWKQGAGCAVHGPLPVIPARFQKALANMRERAEKAEAEVAQLRENGWTRADKEAGYLAAEVERLAARIRELELEQDNAGFISWAGAQDALNELTERAEAAEERAARHARHHLEHHDDETARVFAPAETRIQELETALETHMGVEATLIDRIQELERALKDIEAWCDNENDHDKRWPDCPSLVARRALAEDSK